MNRLFTSILSLLVAAISTSCISIERSLKASNYIGAPQNIERILKTDDGFAFEVVYRNRDAKQRLFTTTDPLGENPKFADSNVEGVPVPFERVERSDFHSSSHKSQTGTYPYGFVTASTTQTGSGGISAGAYILTSPDYLVSVHFPTEKPDWAARVSQAPGAILRDTLLLPIMVPIAILTPRIDG